MSSLCRRYAAHSIYPLDPGLAPGANIIAAAARLGSCGPSAFRADSRLVYPRAEALGSANRKLAGLKPSASTEPKRYSDSGTSSRMRHSFPRFCFVDNIIHPLSVEARAFRPAKNPRSTKGLQPRSVKSELMK